VKILFLMRHAGYGRLFEPVLCSLAGRGHELHVVIERLKSRDEQLVGQRNVIADFCEQFPNMSQGPLPRPPVDGWLILSARLRAAIDYLRYLERDYRDASKLRARAAGGAPELVRRLATWPVIRTPAGGRALSRILCVLEQAITPPAEIAAFIRAHRPDLILVTPLVSESAQVDCVRAARALGIPTGLCVASWDNLTNKGMIQGDPDLVTVWNEAMRREAVELHGVPAERVVITGAPVFDHWFERGPSTRRPEFCAKVQLRADRPFILFMGSSPFIAPRPREVRFVRDWIRRLRASGNGRLREAGVLIRPHPQNAAQWQEADLSDFGEVVVWPRNGAGPVTPESKAEYYDSIYHSAAVVGVNTSGLIESAIVGRGAYTWLTPEFRETQEGTLHFHHLVTVNGGMLHVAQTFDAHAAQLVEALGEGGAEERARGFVEAFVRPFGLDEAATPRLVATIEELGARTATVRRARPALSMLIRSLLTPLAFCLALQDALEGRRVQKGLRTIGKRVRTTYKRARAFYKRVPIAYRRARAIYKRTPAICSKRARIVYKRARIIYKRTRAICRYVVRSALSMVRANPSVHPPEPRYPGSNGALPSGRAPTPGVMPSLQQSDVLRAPHRVPGGSAAEEVDGDC
jgi:hypothetical protein